VKRIGPKRDGQRMPGQKVKKNMLQAKRVNNSRSFWEFTTGVREKLGICGKSDS